MISIDVPGTAPAPPVPKSLYLGVGISTTLLVAVLAWVAMASGDPSLWALPIVITVIMTAYLGSSLLNLVGRAGRIRLTREKGCWAALGSRRGQLLLLTAAILTLLIPIGFIVVVPDAHLGVWLFALIGLLGIAEIAIKIRGSFGWRFEEHILSVIVPKKGPTAFTWNEVESVKLRGRAVVVTGRGETVENPGDDVASDPAVVARVIEFYRTNARFRPELSDDRFLERLRSGRL